ncbi:C-C motif chemokine 7-like [Amia ocellicauda]|uniref:C-C motif chemokine 7 n=1 Tax=Amia ocellicauda TaxID=2972642 RepID=UPI003464E580
MNSLTFALILALLCTLSHYSSATSASNISDKCCTEFTHKVIPKKMIVSYQKTNSNCPKDGVIFKTLKRGEVCVDPAVKWVKACMEHLDSQTTVKPQTAAKL